MKEMLKQFHLDVVFYEVEFLQLIDNQTGSKTDLLATPDYTFSASSNDYPSRFKLVFDPHFGVGENEGVPFASHKIVRHAVKEFVKGMASTNEIESVWSILKRGWVGVYHHFSQKHIQLYVNEFCFRLNEGKCDVKFDERIRSMCFFSLKKAHLSYKELLMRDGDNVLMRAA